MSADHDIPAVMNNAWNPSDVVLGALLGILAWFSRRTLNQLDKKIEGHGEQLSKHDESIKFLEKTVVSRAELMAYMEQIRLERRDMHKDNQDCLHELRDSLNNVRSDLLDMSRAQRGGS